MISIELVTYDPDNPDTYPSVCAEPGEVKQRFGFEGGETLVFAQHGQYLGELTKQLDEMIGESALQAAWVPIDGNTAIEDQVSPFEIGVRISLENRVTDAEGNSIPVEFCLHSVPPQMPKRSSSKRRRSTLERAS